MTHNDDWYLEYQGDVPLSSSSRFLRCFDYYQNQAHLEQCWALEYRACRSTQTPTNINIQLLPGIEGGTIVSEPN